MQINNVARIDSSVPPWTSSEKQPLPAASTAKTATQPVKVASQTVSSASPAASVAISSAVSQISPLNKAQVSTLSSYSATVGGKNYPEAIAESAGVYVASVPDPPGASATGSTIQSAEHNLEVKLDTLA